MPALRIVDHITVEEYLEGEMQAELRHEYIYSEVHAMADATIAHNVITTNVARGIGNAAEIGDCRTYSSDMKIRVSEQVFYSPDVMLVCEDPANDYFETQPCVIVEVLSETSARNALFEKRLAYTELSSLQFYLLVDSRKRKVTGFYRTVQGWEERKFSIEDLICIPRVNAELSFEQIYAKSGC